MLVPTHLLVLGLLSLGASAAQRSQGLSGLPDTGSASRPSNVQAGLRRRAPNYGSYHRSQSTNTIHYQSSEFPSPPKNIPQGSSQNHHSKHQWTYEDLPWKKLD